MDILHPKPLNRNFTTTVYIFNIDSKVEDRMVRNYLGR